METQKQISNGSMILGIIGGILGLPAAVCSGACAAGLTAITDTTTAQTASDVGTLFLWIGLLAALMGLVSAFLYKKNPKIWGLIMLLSGLLWGVTLITFNILSLIVCILFLIGGAVSLTQKKPTM